MNPKSSNFIISAIVVVLILLGVYIFFSIKPTQEQVQGYTKPVLVVPQDILSSISDDKLKDYSANQPIPMQPNASTRDNPFSPY